MRLSLLLILTLLPVARSSDSWPQYRGPDGNGVSDSRHLPVSWSEKENVRWKTAIHGKGWSSPVVWGNQVWVTTATPDGKEYFAVGLDRKTGSIIHDLKLFTEEHPAFCYDYNSYASSTPVIEEGRLYFHFGSAGTGCLDTSTGKTLWLRRDMPCDHWRGPGSSPIVYGKLLILTFDGFDLQYLTALDKETGKTVWKTDRNIAYIQDNGDHKKAYSTPSIFTINGKAQLVSPSAEAAIAYDPNTGQELWRISHDGMNAALRPTYAHGLVYLTTGNPNVLLAVRAGQSGLLTKDDVAWRTNRAVPSRSSPLIVDDFLFMVSDQGVASCLDAKTGKQFWQERLGKAHTPSPVWAEGRVYFPDEHGTTYVVEASKTFKLLATNKLDDGCMASPAIAGDAIYLRTKTHLYCLGK